MTHSISHRPSLSGSAAAQHASAVAETGQRAVIVPLLPYFLCLGVFTSRNNLAGLVIRRKLIVTVITVFVTFVLRAAFASLNAYANTK